MASTAVVGLNAGKGLLSSSFSYAELNEKLSSYCFNEHHHHLSTTWSKTIIISKKNTHSSIKPFNFKEEHAGINASTTTTTTTTTTSTSTTKPWIQDRLDEGHDYETSVEALLLLQKSMLEKQLKLCLCHGNTAHVTSSGIPARQRRTNKHRRRRSHSPINNQTIINPDLLHNRLIGYVRGVTSDELLTHSQVVNLSQKIKAGLSLEEHRSRLKERLGSEPSDEQLAMSLRISCAELRSKFIECSLAREKLVMSNVRLVRSVAQRYENLGADMPDLIQGGLTGLLRGIEKFDSSKGFKISTYVYWWIRQGVSRALVENSRTLRLPTHLHQRLSLIRNAKNRLEEKGITPSIDRIAEHLNMSHKKIKNATEAVRSVLSLDREVFPSLNGLPGETFHSYIADKHVENNPWHGVDEWAIKHGVNNLIDITLREREKDIIRLYYGLDDECLTWEEISKRIGLSRERVRQVGLVALEKLKHAARKRRMEALIVEY